jgi:hypothetical protein
MALMMSAEMSWAMSRRMALFVFGEAILLPQGNN